MKTTHILTLAALIVFIGCGEKISELDQKKASLKALKQQMNDLKTQISSLQKEIDLADTIVEGGVPIKVMEVVPKTFVHYIDQPGTVSSKENVVVSSEVGAIILNRLVEEGSWVSKGQPIVQLDAEVMSNQVEELRQSAQLAQTTFERQDNLWKQGIGSEIQFLQAQNQYLSLSKRLAAMEAQLDKFELIAPISGKLDEIFINAGEYASPGRPILRIVNSKKLQIEADVAERYSSVLKKGDNVKIAFQTLGVELENPITFVGQVINPENRTFKLKINLNNSSGNIKPNAVASLQIKDFSAEQAMVLPSAIIKKDMRGNFVFITDGIKAQKKYIQVGLSQGTETHVVSGLEVGQQVISTGYDEVADGSLVEIKK